MQIMKKKLEEEKNIFLYGLMLGDIEGKILCYNSLTRYNSGQFEQNQELSKVEKCYKEGNKGFNQAEIWNIS